MKNFISLNIKYLCEQNNLQYNEFAEIVDAGRSVVSMWVAEKSNPKIEAMQKICKHFNITLDDFVNRNLKTQRIDEAWSGGANEVYEPSLRSPLEETLRSAIEDKDKIIKMLEEEIKRLKGNRDYNSKTA
ncbi:MAG: helix-turn-helix transcriptional regulator [Aequorivita sp.]|nr:helix-turn-helix transcriptional regulator [Aequorivita sp.]